MFKHKFPIKAFIRVRSNQKSFIIKDKTIKITTENNQESEYLFDGVFPYRTSQMTIFDNIKESLVKFQEGFNTTIFCYGNTGAGKTHTMIGSDNDPGLIFNIVRCLLKENNLQIGYMEIYNEKIFDLLDPKELTIRENEGKIVISLLERKSITTYEEFKKCFKIGNANRKIAETKLNKTSSRSHVILQIVLGNAKLYLIDLAGSENNRKTGNEGIRMVESSNINKSLFVLGQVINSILNNSIRIPYRDSKLTRLLQDSLGGQSICYIIANIIDEWDYLDETISTLKFASKTRKIVNVGSTLQTDTIKNKNIVSEKKTKENVKSSQKKNTNIEVVNKKILKDKTNTPKKKKKEDSTFLLKSSLYDKTEILMTPNTQEKSYKAFLKRAEEFEKNGNLKKALDDYKILKKIRDNFEIKEKIEEINNKIKEKRLVKNKITKRELLDILNSGSFLQIKKLSNIGDKRAQNIVDFINGGNFFENLDDLKLIFTEKIISSILNSVEYDT